MSDYRIETKCIQSGYEPGERGAEDRTHLSEHHVPVYEQRADGTTV